MTEKALFAVLLAVGLYILYLAYNSWTASSRKEFFEVPAPAPIITTPIPPPPREVAPAGPQSPAQAPPTQMPAVRLPPPSDSDPYEEDYGSSNIQDNMRYPERLFGPAPQPKNTAIAVGAGVASEEEAVVAQAIQSFSPELAMNGGQVLDGVFANDTRSPTNFSAL